MNTLAEFDSEIVDSIHSTQDIAVLFDIQLNYLIVNEAACRQLNKQRSELIGKCVLDVFPHIIASENHRNMLLATEGNTINNFLLHGLQGEIFRTSYLPVYAEGAVNGILVNAHKINPGERQLSFL